MLELKNVSKYYHTGETINMGLHNVSIKLNKGEFVAIVGDSGSGKSTLFLTICIRTLCMFQAISTTSNNMEVDSIYLNYQKDRAYVYKTDAGVIDEKNIKWLCLRKESV